jgi:hypothetical protein
MLGIDPTASSSATQKAYCQPDLPIQWMHNGSVSSSSSPDGALNEACFPRTECDKIDAKHKDIDMRL